MKRSHYINNTLEGQIWERDASQEMLTNARWLVSDRICPGVRTNSREVPGRHDGVHNMSATPISTAYKQQNIQPQSVSQMLSN